MAGLMLPFLPETAVAHSEITSTVPEQGARVTSVPDRIVVRFSEPPSDARIIVTDGCGEKVGRRRVISGSTVKTRVPEAAAGRWKVVVKTISSKDEHLATDRFGFSVAGKPRCGAAAGSRPPAEESQDRVAGGAGDDAARGSPSSDVSNPSSSAPVLAIVAGVVVAAGATGLLFRRRRT
jgi:methionine-rich copper-binding protein CopC